MGLSEGQFTALKFGVPVVAVFALASAFGKKRAAEAEAAAAAKPAAGGLVPASPLPSTDAVGVGQLAEFESGVTAALGQLSETVGSLSDQQQAANNAPPATAPTYIAPPAFDTAPWSAPAFSQPAPAPALSCIPGWPCAPPGMTAYPIIVQGVEIGVGYS
jgi:hypothetical protein